MKAFDQTTTSSPYTQYIETLGPISAWGKDVSDDCDFFIINKNII